MKSGNLNFLEPSGSLQACNGTALPYFILNRDMAAWTPLKRQGNLALERSSWGFATRLWWSVPAKDIRGCWTQTIEMKNLHAYYVIQTHRQLIWKVYHSWNRITKHICTTSLVLALQRWNKSAWLFYTGGADKSLARPISRCILFDGDNISFDASLVVYINSTNIPPIMIINRIYEHQNLLSL